MAAFLAPTAVLAQGADTDGDGVPDATDCRPADPATWSSPTEATALSIGGPGRNQVSWSPPAAPGASAPLYDVLRSAAAGSFAAALCVARSVSGGPVGDDALPATASAFFYLVRAKTACGGTLGADSSGAPRAGTSCAGLGGEPCTAHAMCASTWCVDGVCCENSCAGSCERCDLPTPGVCAAIPAGTDPHAECSTEPASSCGTTGDCSGEGTCALYPGGTVCAPASCASATTANRADTCTGNGICADGGTQNCAPYVCSAAVGQCKTSCTTAADCQAGYQCSGGACRKANGSACLADAECAAGFCTDGVCCESRCLGACEKCNASGRLGFCDPVPAATDPDNECAVQPASTCGTTGACSGARSCSLHPSGTTCVAAYCASSTESARADTCNGAGTCVDNGVQNCVPYTCNGVSGACRTGCLSASDCAPGYSCMGGACR